MTTEPFDPDEKFGLPDRTNLDEVLRRLLEAEGTDEVSDEPEEKETGS
jgi:hypothetical protein